MPPVRSTRSSQPPPNAPPFRIAAAGADALKHKLRLIRTETASETREELIKLGLHEGIRWKFDAGNNSRSIKATCQQTGCGAVVTYKRAAQSDFFSLKEDSWITEAISGANSFDGQRVQQYFGNKGFSVASSVISTLSDNYRRRMSQMRSSPTCSCASGHCRELPPGIDGVEAASQRPLDFACSLTPANVAVLPGSAVDGPFFRHAILELKIPVLIKGGTLPGLKLPTLATTSAQDLKGLCAKKTTDPVRGRIGQKTVVWKTLKHFLKDFSTTSTSPPIATVDITASSDFEPSEAARIFAVNGTPEAHLRKVGAGTSTDWHLDFGCAQVVSLAKGRKRWFLLPGCGRDHRAEKAMLLAALPQQRFSLPTLLGHPVQWIDQHAGETLILPPGTWHAVYSFEDSVLIGSTILQGLDWRPVYGAMIETLLNREEDWHPELGRSLAQAANESLRSGSVPPGLAEACKTYAQIRQDDASTYLGLYEKLRGLPLGAVDSDPERERCKLSPDLETLVHNVAKRLR